MDSLESWLAQLKVYVGAAPPPPPPASLWSSVVSLVSTVVRYVLYTLAFIFGILPLIIMVCMELRGWVLAGWDGTRATLTLVVMGRSKSTHPAKVPVRLVDPVQPVPGPTSGPAAVRNADSHAPSAPNVSSEAPSAPDVDSEVPSAPAPRTATHSYVTHRSRAVRAPDATESGSSVPTSPTSPTSSTSGFVVERPPPGVAAPALHL